MVSVDDIKRIVFQFTPLREGRRELARSGISGQLISIHAPA